MWNFSDLAKHAQELTEKASASSGLFNLDAMQGSSEPPKGALITDTAAPENQTPDPTPTPSLFGLPTIKSEGSVIFGSPAPALAPVSNLFATPIATKAPQWSLTQQLPVAAVKSEAEPLQKVPAIVETKTGSNDWDNDWDFDEQVVEDDKESKPLPVVDEIMEKTLPLGIDALRSATEQPYPLHKDENRVEQRVEKELVEVTNMQDGMAIENASSQQLPDPPFEKLTKETPEEVEEKPPEVEAPNEWKEEDLDDIYDDDDDDDDDEDGEGSENDIPNNHDAVNGAQEPHAVVEDMKSGAAPFMEPRKVDEPMFVAADPTYPDLPQGTDGVNDVTQDPSSSANVEDETATSHETIQVPSVQLAHSHDMDQDVEQHSQPGGSQTMEPDPIAEPLNSLEDEIAGMLDDRSQPEHEPPVDVFDQIIASTDILMDQNHDTKSFGFSEPVEEEPTVKEAVDDETQAEVFDSIIPTELLSDENHNANPPGFSERVEEEPFAKEAAEQSEASFTDVISTVAQPTDDVDSNSKMDTPTTASEPETAVVDPAADAGVSKSKGLEKMIPASILDQFTSQMHRLEEHHQIEIQDLQISHEQALENVRNSFSHSECEAQRAELESNFLARLREKDEQLQEIMHVNEGMELKMEVLKREVAGTKKLLEERDKQMVSSTTAHDQEKKLLMEKLKKLKDNAGSTEADVQQLQAQLKAAQGELEESNEAYAALKARVKAVATELKERRAECRTLAATNVELSEANERITAKLAGLQAQLDDRDRSEVEKGEERDELRAKVKTLEEELQEADKKIQERDAVGEKALAAYKKKAQNSLAVANARAAAALQAKEEADLEARAARSTADNAVERARKAETKGSEALEEARTYVKEIEVKVAEMERRANLATNSLDEMKRQLAEATAEGDGARAAREKMAKEVVALSRDLQLEKNTTSELQQECNDLQRRSNDLYDEVETLREELRKNATASFMAHNNEGPGSEANGGNVLRSRAAGVNAADKSESESTIVMLQRELRDANQAIKELKETLRATIESSEQNDVVAGSSSRAPIDNSTTQSGNANDSTPLFYAMEKQAELNQAREEINRLANLLGELQSEKMQAYEAVEEMKRDKASAEARLARYEKLGTTGGGSKRSASTRLTKSAVYGGYGSHPAARKHVDSDAMSIGSVDSTDSMDGPSADSSQVNLEYLKNVMLSYLNAKTLNERKRLVPAVSAVLCLTAEESAAAMKSVLESGSVESVGLSFFEGLKLM